MIILRSVYHQLLRSPEIPPETGGILGMKNSVINSICFDSGLSHSSSCNEYVPDVSFFNNCIDAWQKNGIVFCGMFHTHLPQWSTLSGGDKTYIRCIMNSLPRSINQLFFPLVFPGHSIRSFVAIRENNRIYINEDTITIVETEAYL